MSAEQAESLSSFCEKNKLSQIEPQLAKAKVTLTTLQSKNESELTQLSNELELGTLFRRRLFKAVLGSNSIGKSVSPSNDSTNNNAAVRTKNENGIENESMSTLGFDIPAMDDTNANESMQMHISPMTSPKQNDISKGSKEETETKTKLQKIEKTENTEKNESGQSKKNEKKKEAATAEETRAMHALFNEFNECCNSIDLIRESFDMLDKNYNECKNNINSKFDEYMAMIYQKQEALLKLHNEMVNGKKIQLKTQYDSLSYHQNIIKEGINKYSQYIHDPSLQFNSYQRQQSILSLTNTIMEQDVNLFLSTNPNVAIKYDKQLFNNVFDNSDDSENDNDNDNAHNHAKIHRFGEIKDGNLPRICNVRPVNVSSHSITIEWNVEAQDDSELLENGLDNDDLTSMERQNMQGMEGSQNKKEKKNKNVKMKMDNLRYQIGWKKLRIENLKIDDKNANKSEKVEKKIESKNESIKMETNDESQFENSSDSGDSSNEDEKSEVKGKRSIVDASDIEWHLSSITTHLHSTLFTIKQLNYNESYLIKVRCYDVTRPSNKNSNNDNGDNKKGRRSATHGGLNDNDDNDKNWTQWSKPISVTTGATTLEWGRRRCAMSEQEWNFVRNYNNSQQSEMNGDFKTSVVKVKNKRGMVSFYEKAFGKVGINFVISSHKHLKFGWKYTILSYNSDKRKTMSMQLGFLSPKESRKEKICLGFMDQKRKVSQNEWKQYGFSQNLLGCASNNNGNKSFQKHLYWQVPINGQTRDIQGNKVYVKDPLSYYVEIAPFQNCIYICAPLGKEHCLRKSCNNENENGKQLDQNSDNDDDDDDGSDNNDANVKYSKYGNRAQIKCQLKKGQTMRSDTVSFVADMHTRQCLIYLNDQLLDVSFKDIPTSIVPIVSNCVNGNAATISVSGMYV